MKRVASAIAALGLASSLGAQDAASARVCHAAGEVWARLAAAPGTIVVDRDELQQRGWTRVTDALQASTWSIASLEGYTFEASADGLPPARLSGAGQPDWVVFVDGQRVPVRVAGTRLLELLPVTAAQVERVVLVRGPLVAGGRLASRGTIWVETVKARANGVAGTYAIGNERGDPGPYRYTDLSTPNVERLGPDAVGAAFLRAGRVDAQVSARYSTLNVTDEALLPRLHPDVGATGRDLWQEVVGASARVGVQTDCGGRHDLVIGRMRFAGALYQPTRDDWTETSLLHAGASGHGAVGRTTYRYAATLSRSVIDTLPPDPSPALPRDRDALTASAHVGRTMRGVQYTLDGSIGRWSAGVPIAHVGTATATELSALVGAAWARPRVAVSLTAGVAGADAVTGPQLAAAATVVTGPSSSLRLEAGHDGATRDGEAWTDSVGAPDAAPTLHWAGASWWRETRGVRFGLGADLRRVAGWRARTRAEDARGDVTALGVDAEAAYAGDGGTLSLRYRIDRPTSDTPDVDAALAATPRQQLRASATTSRLPGNFRLSGAAMLRSATTWPAAGADSVARELPALVRLDATVEKWLWRDRARVFAAARNLLDREERYHPAGAHFAFRVHVGAELDLR